MAELRAVSRRGELGERCVARQCVRRREAVVTTERVPGPRSERILAQERQHMAAGLQSFALHAGRAMARGTGSTLIDEDGNTYIDFIAGIAVGSVGHCHPHYVKTLQEQAAKLTFGSFTTEVRAKFLNL